MWKWFVFASIIVIVLQWHYIRKLRKKAHALIDGIEHFSIYGKTANEISVKEGCMEILENQIKKLEEQVISQRKCHRVEQQHLNQFMENMAHQMKTALTAIQIRMDLLKQDLTGEVALEDWLRCQACVERLDGEVTRILRASQLAAEKIGMKYGRCLINGFILQTAENLQPIADKKKVKIIIKTEEGLFLQGDLFWLGQALENILKNAIEHTKPSGVVSITAGGRHRKVHIRIEDQGEGIADEEIPFLFERFHRGMHAKAGYGIGLSMAMDIIKFHHGMLSAGNSVGQGAWFLLEIPILEGTKPYETVSSIESSR